MTDASQRIAALSDEKRELLELLRQEKLRKKRAAVAPPPSETPEPAPFALVADADRARLPEVVEDAYPLTLMQAGMLYHMEREPEHALYHNVDTFRVEGHFRPELFQRAVDRVVRRHPVLRTSFDLHSYNEPLQLVHREAHLPVRLEDLRGTSPEVQKAMIDAYAEAEKDWRFDFASPPLLRFGVHQLGERSFQFTVTDFHPILDGWSLQSTLAEILSLYGAMLSGEEPPEPPLPASTFKEFVRLERQALASEEQRLWWERLLEGASLLRLPRWPQPPRRPGARAFCTLPEEVPAALFNALHELARVAAVPFKSVLLACHLKALEVVSGRSDIVTGLVSHGRPEAPGSEDVRGLFLNTLPFRMRLPRGSWLDLIRAVFEAERELVPYRRYPLPALQQRWGQERLFETAFNFTHFHVLRNAFEALEQSGNGLHVADCEMREETSFTFLVSFNVEPSGSGMHIAFLCHLLELPEAQVTALVSLYFRILHTFAAEPFGASTDSLSLLGDVGRQQIFCEWNDTAAPFLSDLVHERFLAQAALTPGTEAVRCGERSLSYGELRRLSMLWANRLRQEGVGPETLVALCVDRAPEAIVAVLAVVEAGAAYVPLDPSYPRERLEYMLADSGARVLLTLPSLIEVLPAPNVRRLFLDREPEAEPLLPHVRPQPENLAYVLYTSGSTGKPKGVAMSHRALANLIDWQLQIDDRPLGRTLQFAPLSFDASFHEIFSTLSVGGTLVLVSEETRRDTPALLELLRREQVERLFLPFVALQQLAETAADYGLIPSFLGEVITAGEQLQVSSGVRALFRQLPGSSLHNAYGPTEAHVVSALPLRGDPDDWPVLPAIGVPIANHRLHVLGEGFAAIPWGGEGELWIGGIGLARGYLGRPDLTAERFVPDPFTEEPGARLYRTGDLALYMPDGKLEFLGRVDRQVKIRGFRIEPGGIEAALAGHPDVQEAVVAVREEGSGRKRLVAYVVARPGRELSARELRSHLAGRLPEHEVPSAFVLLDRLPLTPSGKVDRRALPAPETGGPEGFVAPRTPTEEVLAGIWAEVLRCEHVGATDNFFELGGHSLVATQVVARAREVFRIELPVRTLFEAPTLAGLARHVEALANSGRRTLAPPLAPVGRERPPCPSLSSGCGSSTRWSRAAAPTTSPSRSA
jgi:amino acid adenylation domain-containing protein